jgi:Rho GTPase-activating protein RGD1
VLCVSYYTPVKAISEELTNWYSPSLMGQHTGLQIADASLQARVVDTILVNATAIFDDD